MKNACEVCLMPFSKDPGKRESEHYCSLCYQDGHLRAEGLSLKEYKAQCYEEMRAKGMGKLQAKFYTWMIGFAPYWNKR